MDITNKELLYKIVCARDNRYDGRFFCGVHTTGIYCRPICPARPKLQNISFYRSSTEAENAGFRACLRCRPDLAPNSVQWNGTAAVVGRALTMISRGEADEVSFEKFADKLGISDRHLRRLFDEHVGASPLDVATSKRLHLAKQLLTQSHLPVTEVAFASGYKSIRQFNHAFKEKFKTAPSSLRKSTKRVANKNFISVDVPIIAPFNWNHIFGFLKNHGMDGVESFKNNCYRRCFSIENFSGAIEVSYDSKNEQLRAQLSVSDPTHIRIAIERIRDLFDTRLNPHAHLTDFKAKDAVADCYRKELGLRIPGAWDSFETAICIILGQLVSVEQAKFKIKNLIQQFGQKISNPVFEECAFSFPTPKVLATANLKDIGMTRVREAAINELAQQFYEKKINLSRSADISKTKQQLLAIKGIGPWTVEMIAMRCLGDANAFPTNDLIIKRALTFHGNEKGDWSPWNAYISLALWKKYAAIMSQKRKIASSTK